MTVSEPTASIVIPTLAAPAYLDVALASVMPQAAEHGADVVVIVDGPDPVTEEVVRRHGAVLIVFPHRRGLNSGRNAGIEASRGELIVFVDQDIEAPPGWLAALIAGARAYPDRDMFGGPIRARLEGARRGCGREPAPITTLDAGPEDCDVPLVWGANMAIRRRAFARLGPFDPELLGRGDEEEFEYRYTAAGGRIRYLAAAGLDHRRARADATIGALARAAYGQGREARRHDSRFGHARPVGLDLRFLLGCVWHTLRRRCPYGIVMGARAAGGLREALSPRAS
ncbi:MAG TPA: glycosyltransferase family A protein [Solirubrobacteraceae bacterium]|nr:glycosyltransferase family A protein [Solirubrobacteraceae bacterium]